jgi:hypothetical protein
LAPTATTTATTATNNNNNKISIHQRRLTLLYAERDNKTKGVYVRPSGAIERGSGFFFPGLEGPRVRLVVGSILLLLTGVNQITAPHSSLSFEVLMAILYSLLLLFQALIEFGKEELIVEGGSASATSTSTSTSSSRNEEWTKAMTLDDEYKSKVQWAAASYLSVTPASQIMLLQQESTDNNNSNNNIMVYRLGGGDDTTKEKNPDEESSGIQAALEQLRQSKGGRISLPLSHPAVVALGLQDDTTTTNKNNKNNTRCIVLQRITDDSCWMMTSDQLLASFTSSDLKWLGQLAAYVRDK